MPSRFSTDYRNLRPYVLEDVRAAVQAAIVGGLSAKYGAGALTAHRLDDTTVHIGTLSADQFPRGLLRDGSRSLAGNLPVDTGVTIDGVDISAHAADPDAHHARAHVLATAAGLGADHSMSGAAAGQTLRANSATNAMWAYLSHNDLTGVTADQHHAKQHDITDAANHTVSGAAWNVVGATALNTLGLLLARSDATGTPKETLLKSDSSGALSLTALYAPLLGTATGNITAQPAGDWIFDPVGNDVLPATNYDINLGALFKKYLTIHAAELWVETLVAQNTIATIGGRILVGPTTTLTRDLAAAATTIYVKHNQMVSGDRAYMEAGGSVEFFAITSGPTLQGAGDYAYTVTRNLDGTGANDWYAGDAMFNTGTTGNGWIDLYSIRGVKSASQYGPTIVGNVRNSATYNDWSERWAVGNLNGLYGYGVDTYGFAAGVPSGTWVAVDAANGLRIARGSVTRFNVDTNGDLAIRDKDGNAQIVLDSAGNSYFAGVMTIGTSGEIRQGTGTLGSNYTGLRIWRDTNVGRIAGYNNNVLQWYAGTNGYLYAGGGAAAITRYGYMVQDTPDNPSFAWPFLWGGLHAVNDITTPGTGWKSSLMFGEPTLVYSGGQRWRSWLFQFAGDLLNPPVSGEGSAADYALTVQDAAGHTWPVWHAGNDGAGSGLDAGMLAGLGLSAAGNRWGVIPYVDDSNGTMDVGKYLDFHPTDGDTSDYTHRIAENAGGLFHYPSGAYAGSISTPTNAFAYGYFEYIYNSVRSGYLIWNAQSINIYSDNNCHINLTPHGGGKVGINRVDPSYTLDVNGEFRATGAVRMDTTLSIAPVSTPATSAVYSVVYVDSADGKLKYKTTGGVVRTLSYT